MSLHDEFEAVKHAPHELVAWVKSLLVRLEGEPVADEPVSTVGAELVVTTPAAPEGQDHA